jgi:hypothetical protein
MKCNPAVQDDADCKGDNCSDVVFKCVIHATCMTLVSLTTSTRTRCHSECLHGQSRSQSIIHPASFALQHRTAWIHTSYGSVTGATCMLRKVVLVICTHVMLYYCYVSDHMLSNAKCYSTVSTCISTALHGMHQKPQPKNNNCAQKSHHLCSSFVTYILSNCVCAAAWCISMYITLY